MAMSSRLLMEILLTFNMIFLTMATTAGNAAAGAAVKTEKSSMKLELSMLDVVLIIALIIVGAWYYRRKRQQRTEQENSMNKLQMLTTSPTSNGTAGGASGSFIDKMKASSRNVVIFYGSQTGTAEEFSGRLAKDAQRYLGKKGLTCDPEECEMEDLVRLKEIPKSLAIFCIATYGEGDPTDNAQELYDWLQNTDADLSGMSYTIFGLGNKTYEHFNAMGIYFDKRFAELNATRVFEAGVGDDDANIEEDFIQWKERLWPAVCEHFGVDPGSLGDGTASLRQYNVVVHDVIPTAPDAVPNGHAGQGDSVVTPTPATPTTPTPTSAAAAANNAVKKEKIFTGEIARLNSYIKQRPPFDAKNPFLAAVTAHRELHTGGDRSCMHVELDITDSRIRYEAGDHVAVYPTNDPLLVARLGELLSVDLDQTISLVATDEDATKKYPFPCPTTWRTALTHYLDITSLPRTNVLSEIADYCSDEGQKTFLKSLASATLSSGKAEYQKWIYHDCRSIIHVLEDMATCRPDIGHLCELLPRLQPRYYSISSSPKMYPNSIHITAVVVNYRTNTGRTNKGVATSYLSLRKPTEQEQLANTRVPIYVRRSQFRLPFKSLTPVVMIGPGTGIAPFRGFIQDRCMMRKQVGKQVGATILYTGFRKRAEDYLYVNELEQYLADGTLSKLYVAFSRDQADKVYVQQLVRQNGEEMWRLMNTDGAHVYVCGDARYMARDVHEAIFDIIRDVGKLSGEEAKAYLKKMESQRRYSADVWS